MGTFNYDSYYENRDESYAQLVKETGKRKATYLKRFLKDLTKKDIIAEVGTGPGDVLNNFDEFRIKIGLDISLASLQSQINTYFKYKIDTRVIKIDFETFYNKWISKNEIISGFKDRPVYSDGNLHLIKTELDCPLPFEDKSIDYLILCDIVEHVAQPIEFLKDASRICSTLLLKFPVENAVLVILMCKLRGIKYGVNHPSGHLFYWSEKEIFSMLKKSNIEILEYEFEPTKYEYSEDKFKLKKIVFSFVNSLDFLFSKAWFFSKFLLGGNIYILAKGK